MGHDLLDFGGAFISLTSIHAVIDEVVDEKPTGIVHIYYGNSDHRAAFVGDAASVMDVINDYGRLMRGEYAVGGPIG